jgi:signal transduction histidine kinase
VGGSCTVSSPPDGGTEVRARLPLTDPERREEDR